MGLDLITPTEVEPITLEQLKGHLKITWDSEDDTLRLYLRAARDWVETYTRRAIMPQTWRLSMDDFPPGIGYIELPFGKCQPVDQITYYDVDGVQQTLTGPTSQTPGANYQEDLSSTEGAKVRPPIDGDWPSVQSDRIAGVEIDFTAGWADAYSVPPSITTAVLYRATDYYAFRGSDDEGDGTDRAKHECNQWRLIKHAG